MHDPSTVAFDIKYPWRQAPSKFWPKGYRSTFITIWHEDPLNFKGKCGCRDDDSCGWFRPPFTAEQGERIKKLGRSQYSTLFGKQKATAEGASYAYLSYEPNAYDAIYWAWRAINHAEKKQGVWQYGTHLTRRELQEIFELSSSPVDNFRHSVSEIVDEETCGDFFLSIFRCWQRFKRPWYKHPRWHFWHWRIQVHPWQTFRRWALSRCAGCGRRFAWGESPVSFSWDSPKPKFLCGEVGIYHSDCSAMSGALRNTEAKGNA